MAPISLMKGKRKRQEAEEEWQDNDSLDSSSSSDFESGGDEQLPVASSSSTTPAFRQKVLILSSRGVTQRMRHVMNDLSALLPQTKKGESVHHLKKKIHMLRILS